jgi:beta-glucosidase
MARLRGSIAPVLLVVPYVACNARLRTQDVVLKPADAARDAVRPDPPPSFWWGVSVSSYQTEEPGAFLTDWDLYEKKRGGPVRDGRVAGYSHFERDLAALKYLGVTHFRFSIEWARVEPCPGVFNQSAIEHYVMMARRLQEEGIEPVVCLWHFTFPSWLCDFGHPKAHGWLHPKAADAWERYVRTMVPRLAPHVKLFAPQNEPNMYATAVTIGMFPPGCKRGKSYYNRLTAREVEMFLKAAAIIRESCPESKIMSVQNLVRWERDALDACGFWFHMAQEQKYLHLDGIAAAVDYVGVNYYQREVASPLAPLAQSLRKGPDVSDMGWIIDPQGLEEEIALVSRRYRKPIVILENGIADATDQKRPNYLLRHLRAIRRMLDAGYDVRGYFHWSLSDNYEWRHGYKAKFGLFALETPAEHLAPKGSAILYRSLISGRAMDAEVRFPESITPCEHQTRMMP